MFLALLAIFVIVPLLELWVIIEVGSRIGILPALLTLVLISITGAALAKHQGYRVLMRIQAEVANGKIPGDSLIDGALVLAGALLLLTPGFLTDIAGLLLLIPPARLPVRSLLKRRLKKAAEQRTVFFWPRGFGGGPWGRGGPPPGGAETGARPYGSGRSEPEQRRKELQG